MNTTSVDVAREKVVSIATQVLAGEKSPLIAARELNALRFSVGVPDTDPDFLAFVAVDSETDHLPLGGAQEHWEAEALATKRQETQRSERWAIEFAGDAFRSVIARFAHAG